MLQELEKIILDIEYAQFEIRIRPDGVLSLATSTDFKKRILELLEPEVKSIVLDLSRTTHIDSVGLATLIVLSRTCLERNVQFKLCNPAEYAGRLLKSTGLAKFLIPAADQP